MSAVGSDDEIGFGPGAMQVPGAFHGTDNVVAALDDHSGDMANALRVAQELVVGFEKALMEKIMGLDAGEGQDKFIFFVMPGEVRIGQQFRSGAFQPLQIFAAARRTAASSLVRR